MTERGMGVRELARRVPCNPGYLSNVRNGGKRPSPQTAVRLDDLLGAGGRLADLAGRERARLGARASARNSCGGIGAFGAEGLLVDVGALVMAAAHESGDRAAADAAKLVSEVNIDLLQAEVIRLARNFGNVSPLTFLAECRQSRDLAFGLVERTNRPGQGSDLYLIIGQLCALMAEASFDLAVWPAVIEQAHAAGLYGAMVGYRSLQAWALGMQAITAYWRGRPGEAVKLADAGVALAPAGSPRAHLLSISARAWAHVGRSDRTRETLALADRDRDGIGDVGSDELHDVIGGQFAWGPARQEMSASSTLLAIGDAVGAAGRAREAIRLQAEDQAGGRVSVLARADLAYAELSRGRADAAEAALAPVWDLEPGQRRFGLVERLASISSALGGSRFGGSKPMAGLAERIAEFTADTAPKALPPGALPGGN
jgi:hypothetical protein